MYTQEILLHHIKRSDLFSLGLSLSLTSNGQGRPNHLTPHARPHPRSHAHPRYSLPCCLSLAMFFATDSYGGGKAAMAVGLLLRQGCTRTTTR